MGCLPPVSHSTSLLRHVGLGGETPSESRLGKPQEPKFASQLFRYSNSRTGKVEQKQHICKKPNPVRVAYLGDFDES